MSGIETNFGLHSPFDINAGLKYFEMVAIQYNALVILMCVNVDLLPGVNIIANNKLLRTKESESI